MEFELTIRGNADELPPLLDLLGKGAVQFNSSNRVSIEEPAVLTIVPWGYGKRADLWNDLSEGARELMTHLAVRCDVGEFGDEDWVCDPDYELGVLGCDGEVCEDFLHREIKGERVYVEMMCKINAQSIGARLANITRSLSDSKFAWLASPIIKYLATDNPDSEAGGRTGYQLIPGWGTFVFAQWCLKTGYDIEWWSSESDTMIEDKVIG